MRPFPGLLPCLIALVLQAAPSAYAEDATAGDSRANPFLGAVGVMLMAGGGALAWHQNREADQDMARYRNSAFTGNTELYRKNVEEHEVRAWIGLAGAALGGIFLVVAF